VSLSGKRWKATIGYDSKLHYLGCFDTKQEAALAYDRTARQCEKDTLLNYECIAAAEEAAVQAKAEHTLASTPIVDRPSRKRPRTGGGGDNTLHSTKERPRPPSGFYGVSASGKRWKAQINYDSKTHYLGTFDTKQEAALAYDREVRQCGKDTPLNYESIKAAEEAAVQAQAEHILVHDMCTGPKQPRPRPPSGFYGVSANCKRWKAKICYDSKEHHLGYFDTKQEAALAYDREIRQCGGDRPLNYESIKAAQEAAAHAQAAIFADALCAGPKQPKPRPSSGFYGVYAYGKRWIATIHCGGKQHKLGTFDTKQATALAYDRAARQCGKDKPLNYESIAAAVEAAAQAATATAT
jgi:hypothetical protein